MMWLAWMGAAAIGLSLGLLGSGGSILTVPILVYLVGQPEKVAIAGSLAIVGGISLVAALPWAFRRQVDWRNVAWFGVPGMAGAWIGAWLSHWISGTVQLLMFAVVMLLAAALMLRPGQGAGNSPEGATEQAPPRRVGRIAVDGLVVGVVTGIVGVGGGFLIVPALVLLGGMAVHRAVGTSLWIISLKSFSGFAKYTSVLAAAGLALDWRLIGMFTVVGAGGSLVGGRIASGLPQQHLKRAFAGLLVLMGAGIAWQSIPQVLASEPPERNTSMSVEALVPHARQPSPALLTGGQPEATAWPALRAAGVSTVVNLRTDAEMAGRDEAVETAAHGLAYHHIPVDGGAGVTRANARRLQAVIDAADGTVLVHCASGNRVGALLALAASGEGTVSVEEALAIGRAAGMVGLEPKVRELLEGDDVEPAAAN